MIKINNGHRYVVSVLIIRVQRVHIGLNLQNILYYIYYLLNIASRCLDLYNERTYREEFSAGV